MRRFRFLQWPAYPVAALLVVFPITDALLSVSPFKPGVVSWRFGAMGQLSRALMTPLLGLLLLAVISLALERWRTLRAIAVVSALSVPVLLGVMLLFMLDALELRATVAEAVRTGFDVATAIALTKYGLAVIVATALAVGGWKAGRPSRDSAAPPTAVLVGQASPRTAAEAVASGAAAAERD